MGGGFPARDALLPVRFPPKGRTYPIRHGIPRPTAGLLLAGIGISGTRNS